MMAFGRVGADMRTMNRLLRGAEAIALGMGDRHPDAEHLVLAALELPDGTARRAFLAVGADPDALGDAIGRGHADALAAVGLDPALNGIVSPLDGPPPRGPMRSRPAAQRVFQDAVALARARRPSRITGADVVAAAAALEHGTLPRALRMMGVDPGALRAAAVAMTADADAS